MDLFGNETTQVVPQKKVAAIDPKTKRFNNLLKKIEMLEQKVVETRNHCEEIFAAYKIKVEPLEAQMRVIRINLIKTIYNTVPKLKLNKFEVDDVTEMMIDDLGAIAIFMDLDDEAKRIYETLSKTSVEENINNTNQLGVEMLNEMMQDEGLDIDVKKYDMKKLGAMDPEEVSKLMKDLLEKKIELEESKQNKKSQRKEKKKTQKQLDREALLLEKEDFEKRSLKSLYTSLAKILHPDTEADANLRTEKEEWMKQLTVAYQNQDLATMIKIELHWLQNSRFDPAAAPEKQFNTYINFLNERVKELNFEIGTICNSPQYIQIQDFLPINKYVEPETIEEALENFRLSNVRINELIALMNSKDVSRFKQKKRELNNYVEEYWDAKNGGSFDFFNDKDDDFDTEDFLADFFFKK